MPSDPAMTKPHRGWGWMVQGSEKVPQRVSNLERPWVYRATTMACSSTSSPCGWSTMAVTSMGRSAAEDPVLFEAAAAAGVLAAERLP